MKYRSLYDAAYYATFKTCDKMFDYIDDHGKDPSDSKIGGWMVKYFKKGIEKYSSRSTSRTVTIKTRKYKSGWKIVKVTDAMKYSYMCDFNFGIHDALSDYEY